MNLTAPKRVFVFVCLVFILYIIFNVAIESGYNRIVTDFRMYSKYTNQSESSIVNIMLKNVHQKRPLSKSPFFRKAGRMDKYDDRITKLIGQKVTNKEGVLNKSRKHIQNFKTRVSKTKANRKGRKFARQLELNIEKSQKLKAHSSLIGPGEMGQPVKIHREKLSDKNKKLWDSGFEMNSFNQFVSDMISVNRSLPDVRWPECKNIIYENLPQVSVVIPFINESFSVLVRTVHSILNRSPPELLKEIVLADDASQMEHLGKPLDDYVANFPKVSIQRLKKRQGLVQSRMLGFNHTTAPVVIFIDSHCEVTIGWLEPLLERIKLDYRTVVSAIFDDIDAIDFRYVVSDQSDAFGFTWDMMYDWTRTDYENRTEPIRTATLSGGFIGVSRKFFTEIGMFDEGFIVWGAENLELAFKAWMCHGKVELIPCSRVGHVWRSGDLPYDVPQDDYRGRNSLRLAEVWLDEYKEFVHQFYGKDYVKTMDIGDVSSRKTIKDKLKCKSFQWYIKEIAPKTFIPSRCHAWGPIRSMKFNNTCAELTEGFNFMKDSIYGSECTSRMEYQMWYLCNEGIRRLGGCWTSLRSGGEDDNAGGDDDDDDTSYSVSLDTCEDDITLEWEYTIDKRIRERDLNKCLEIKDDMETITLEDCSEENKNQQWEWTRGQPPGPHPDL